MISGGDEDSDDAGGLSDFLDEMSDSSVSLSGLSDSGERIKGF